MLPPMELRAALEQVTTEHLGIDQGTAIVEASRMLGFMTTSAQIKELLNRELQVLIDSEKLQLRNERLYVS